MVVDSRRGKNMKIKESIQEVQHLNYMNFRMRGK